MTTDDFDRMAEFFLWTEPDKILRIVYGEQHGSYLNEKMKLLRENPLAWYKTLDSESRQSLIDAAFA